MVIYDKIYLMIFLKGSGGTMFNIVVKYNSEIFRLSVPEGEFLGEILSKLNIDFGMPCQGKGLCGKCKVKIVNGAVSEITAQELKILTEKEIELGYRLACLTKVVSDCEIFVPSNGKASILSTGIERKVNINNNYFKETSKHYGITIDIGTTTVVVFLIDLLTGEKIKVNSRLNIQKKFGDDVISRINYTIENTNGRETLQKIIVEQINEMISALIYMSKIEISDIAEVVVVGNTVMLHFLTGHDASNIARAPFTPEFINLVECTCRDIGLDLDAKLVLLPSIASYVGADIVAGVIACDMYNDEKINLMVDIGTNGEIVLGNKNKLMACATAAGPAFEGAHIKCGMGSVDGAINSIIDREGNFDITTIGNLAPIGICGSGLIDAIAIMINNEIIDETGYLEDDFYISDDVYIEPSDVREVQLAKAAIAAGIDTLIHEYGISYKDIDNVYIAGGLGSFINKENAITIGLIPSDLLDKIKICGNTAISGAISFICDADIVKETVKIGEDTQYIELSCSSYFQQCYVEKMMFE